MDCAISTRLEMAVTAVHLVRSGTKKYHKFVLLPLTLPLKPSPAERGKPKKAVLLHHFRYPVSPTISFKQALGEHVLPIARYDGSVVVHVHIGVVFPLRGSFVTVGTDWTG